MPGARSAAIRAVTKRSGAKYSAGEIVARWTGTGALAGSAIGATYGSVLFPFLGTMVGGIVGLMAGLVVGCFDGLVLAWLRPSPADVPLVAQAATELAVLPVQIWLWFVIRSPVYLPLVVAPTVVSLAVAALLGRRLPPAPGPGSSRRRPLAATARWWSIEVAHGAVSAFGWQRKHDSALTAAALISGARNGVWHADTRGVVFQALFDTDEQCAYFLGLPDVRAALAAVPDPVDGLLIHRGRGGDPDGEVRPSAQVPIQPVR